MSKRMGMLEGRPGRRGTWMVVLISVGLAVLGFALFGLPGVLMLEAAMMLTSMVSSSQLGGDQYLPAALVISALGPFALIPVYLILRRVQLTPWVRAMVSIVLTLAVTLLASVIGLILAG